MPEREGEREREREREREEGVSECLFTSENFNKQYMHVLCLFQLARNELATARRLALSELGGVGQCQESFLVLSDTFA